MDRSLGVVLLLLCGIAIGAGGQWLWQYKKLTDAQAEVIAAQGQRDQLIAGLVVAQQERVKAQQQARTSRQAIYAKDTDAAAWARQPVPTAIAERVRNAAKAANAASGINGQSGLPEAP